MKKMKDVIVGEWLDEETRALIKDQLSERHSKPANDSLTGPDNQSNNQELADLELTANIRTKVSRERVKLKINLLTETALAWETLLNVLPIIQWLNQKGKPKP